MKIILKIMMMIQAAMMVAACTSDGFEYNTRFQCYFTFNTAIHNTSIVKACINPMSSGSFCFVWSNVEYDIRHVYFQTPDGKTENNKLTTDEENRISYMLGASNGLILGCSTLNDGQLYAFDRQCPNCLNDYVNKPLQWANNGLWVKCTRCNRSYDLNNSGFVVDGNQGDKLVRYHASFNGSFLHVGN